MSSRHTDDVDLKVNKARSFPSAEVSFESGFRTPVPESSVSSVSSRRTDAFHL